jgi:hypothetical protein
MTVSMKEIVGDLDRLVQSTANDFLRVAKKNVTNRKTIVAVFTYALRTALDDLSPDERATWLALALAEVQR